MTERGNDIDIWCRSISPTLRKIRAAYNVRTIAAVVSESGDVELIQVLPDGEYAALRK